MKFKRNTHDKDGNLRQGLPNLENSGCWPTCNIQLLSATPHSLEYIYRIHQHYDEDWENDAHNYTLPDIMEGLAHLIRLGLVEVVHN